MVSFPLVSSQKPFSSEKGCRQSRQKGVGLSRRFKAPAGLEIVETS